MKYLKFISHKILPLVYDESLSYYEVLCKVVAKVNEVIDYVDAVLINNIRDIVSTLVVDATYDESTETLTIELTIPEQSSDT